ncbi:MAG: pyridoxal-phosphate dependent enzyme [Candidatus Gottesmanbacteria bacterium GW2011_GWA2_43_14]|uniref:Pyridoxal-phosphate dependent enzyme n=1 Tax=Candidatus Gottesmanbacteria bacterium GW2011_GWA2_43_14 TaxID=1618443 RepID=A0A0G1FUR9_9BACT|nr:MAG: pyridoxal-phosphate dependent enzyme [Candidatus Gottesmanbacteria bacterium GW2011_GWA2_43_14]
MKADSNKDANLKELNQLATDKLRQLRHFQKVFSRFSRFLSPGEKKLTAGKINQLDEKFSDFLKSGFPDIYVLRMLVSDFASLMIASDWQSPSYDHSLMPSAGRQTGKISGTVNDYKRDVHLDEKDYEKQFISQYIDALNKFRLSAFLVASGQAAFQTVLTYLQSEGKLNGPVVCGRSSYFQYKQILKGTFREEYFETDETDTYKTLSLIKKIRPKAVFLDSLCNSSEIAVPDLKKIIEEIYRTARDDLYLVIDNTCLTFFCQPYMWRKNNKKVHLITFESLNKYHQFGLDRVTAGVVVCHAKDAAGIYEYRKHAGTNISDFSLFCLPTPNRRLLEKRLLRHVKSALSLTASLVSDGVSVIYPGLPQHHGYPVLKEKGFFGSFFNLSFKNNSPKKFKNIIRKAVIYAKKEKVNLTAGTSFGFSTTRIYLTSLWTRHGTPFLRISCGTENEEEINKLKIAFKKSLQ